MAGRDFNVSGHPAKGPRNDHNSLTEHDIIRPFRRGNHEWEYKGNGRVESYRLQHPENQKTLARIERHDRRKGYFDGGVDLLLRTSPRGRFHAGHYNMDLEQAMDMAERHADRYLRGERGHAPGHRSAPRRTRPRER